MEWTECADCETVKPRPTPDPPAEHRGLVAFAKWAMDTRDSEGIPARYEEIADRAREALRQEDSDG